MNKKYLIHGSYFVNNFGDTLLIKLLCEYVSIHAGNENVFLAINGNIKEQNDIGIPVIGNSVRKDVNCIIYAGGGYFGEPGGSILKILRWSMRNYLRHIYWLRKYPISSIHFIGIGIGPLTNNIFRRAVGQVLKTSKTVLVRDDDSKLYCQKYFPSLSGVDVAVDMALSLKPLNLPKTGCILHVDGLNYNEIFLIIKSLVSSNKYQYFSIVKVIFDNDFSYNHKNISKYKNAFSDAGLNTSQYTFIPYSGTESMINLLSSSELVITSKLHVGIVSISQKTSVISIPTHSKTFRLYRQLGVEEFCISRNDLGVEVLINLINKYDSFSPNKEKINAGINMIHKKLDLILSSPSII